jgi:hypothetical protein
MAGPAISAAEYAERRSFPGAVFEISGDNRISIEFFGHEVVMKS